ncbi:MAG TPA: hypothetical protein DCZ91_12350 [Lachnospiraceae bacterium]|nr:hypothetical protein [Lachnospiraceae bacterium]
MNTILNSVYTADAYLRLSKEDGDKVESDSIVNQKALIREFLKTHPEIQIYEEKVDDGYTGVSFERPAFQEMLEDIKAGRVNCVIVKDDCVILELNSESPENTGLCDVSSVF